MGCYMGVYLGNSVYNDSQVTLEKVEELIEENGKGVFYAEYNVTSYDDVKTAYDDGKIVIAKYSQSSSGGSSYDYFTLVNFNQAMGHSQFVFVEVRTEKLLKKFDLTNDNGWGPLNTVNIGLPISTAADAEKVLTVGSNGDAKYDFLPVGKFGVESPLKFTENSNETSITWDKTGNIGAFLFNRPANLGGGVIWEFVAEEIEVTYNSVDDIYEITNNKQWSNIILAVNCYRPVYAKIIHSTNYFEYLQLFRLYDDSGTWKAIFQGTVMVTDANNNNYFLLERFVVDKNLNISVNQYKPAYMP